MQLNAQDGGNRKFIMVQLPEVTDEKSEAFKAAYKNICDIGKERIRRAKARVSAKVDENNVLLEDVLFSSPSAASMFVTGASSNGYTAWKTADGKTLKDVETSEADEL
mgnify:CR=1 FL=1